MESNTPRARRRRANLRRIVDEALQIVQAEGIDALSVARLAEAADYTPGALYRYFPSKDALVAHLGVVVIEGLAEALEAVEVEAPLARLWAQSSVYRAYSLNDPNGFSLLTTMVADSRRLVQNDETVQPVMTAFMKALAPTARACVEAEAQGVIAPGAPMERAVMLFAALQGVLQLRKQSSRLPGGLPIDRLAGDVVQTVLVGWGAAASAVVEARAEYEFAHGGQA